MAICDKIKNSLFKPVSLFVMQTAGLAFLGEDQGEVSTLVISSPRCYCGYKTIYNPATGDIWPVLCRLRTCEKSRHFMAKRIARQLLEENEQRGITRRKVKKDAWKTEHQRIWRRGGRYKAIPGPGEELELFTDDKEGEPLPSLDEEELTDYIDELLKRTPEDQNPSSSKGFGGEWAGGHAKKEKHKCFDMSMGKIRKGMKRRAASLKDAAQREDWRGGTNLSSLGSREEQVRFLESLEEKSLP